MPKAILIIIDGCRPDGLRLAQTPTIDMLIEHGASTMAATTVDPPLTLPAHFSIFASRKPISHNILTNTASPALSADATLLPAHIRTFGKNCAAAYSWDTLRNLSPPGALEHAFYLDTVHREDGDLCIASAVADGLRRYRPDFYFAYLEGVDQVGHKWGWLSDAYIAAVQQADTAVGIVLNALAETGLDKETHIVVHSDHGGMAYHHKDPVPENMTIPWLAYGPDVRQGKIEGPVSVLDTAPTIARMLGIPPHYSWEGGSLDEIFRSSSV